MRTFVGLFLVFIINYFHILSANGQAMGGPPAGTLPPPCIVQSAQPACTAPEIGNCWGDISAGAADPIFKICTAAGFVEIEKTIHDLPTTFKNTVTIDTTGTLTNNAITTLNGATTVAGAATLSGLTTTISSMTTDITGAATFSGPTATFDSMTATAINGVTSLSGTTTISGATTHTGTTDFNNTVTLGMGQTLNIGTNGIFSIGADGMVVVGNPTNLDFGNNKLQNVAEPTLNNDAATRSWVDELKGGLNITGARTLDFGGNVLKNVDTPPAGLGTDVANRDYVDSQISQVGGGGLDQLATYLGGINFNNTMSTEQTIISASVGSLTVSSSNITNGASLRFYGVGTFSNAGSPDENEDITVTVKLGGSTLGSILLQTDNSTSVNPFIIQGVLSFSAPGVSSLVRHGWSITKESATNAQEVFTATGFNVVNTTSDVAFDITAQVTPVSGNVADIEIQMLTLDLVQP